MIRAVCDAIDAAPSDVVVVALAGLFLAVALLERIAARRSS